MDHRAAPRSDRTEARRRRVAVAALLLALCDSCSSSRAPADSPSTGVAATKPRLVVAVILDQLGSDTLLRTRTLLAPGGFFERALAEGIVYERAVYPYAATLTAPGHAAVHSGATPSQSGVTANYKFVPHSAKPISIVDDGEHAVFGNPSAHASPVLLRVDTVGDALKRATHGEARVVSVSLKDRSAVLPGGKRADLAIWFDAKANAFTTSTYYARELPAWLSAHWGARRVDPKSITWNAHDPAALEKALGPDAAPGEGRWLDLGTTFPHALASSSNAGEAWVMTPSSTDALFALAERVVDEPSLAMGTDGVPDLLAISISGTDYAGHAFGPDSWEYADHLRHADLALMRFVEKLQARTSVAVLVTSDHGAARVPERDPATRGKRIDMDKDVVPKLQRAAESVAGPGKWIAGFVDPCVVLLPETRLHARSQEILGAVIAELRSDERVFLAYDVRSGDPASIDARIRDAVVNSIDPERSGDVYVVLAEDVVPENRMTKNAGTTHGSPWSYDTNVPVLILAPGVTPQRHADAVDQRRVASTLAALLGVDPPLADAPESLALRAP